MKDLLFLSSITLMTWTGYTQPPLLDFQLQTPEGPALVDPVDIASAGDGSGRLFIVEKRGTVRIIENDTVRASYFLDVRPLGIYTAGECGLLGLAFHPDFPSKPFIYIYYIKSGPVSRIARFDVNPNNPDDAQENTEFIILEVDQPSFDNHKAGDLAFGPDGYLYITLGDGGSAGDPGENGQDGQELLGKILRIDIDNGNPYSIPADNPFVDDEDVLNEIWALGMRNPWRLSFDRETGDLWIGDVGQGIWEEIDFEPAGSGGGRNYGWDCYEGNATYEGAGCLDISNYDFPIFVYPHNCSQGPCPYGTGNSITGGFVYRGSEFTSMQGYYICVDYGSENIWLITHDGENTEITMQPGGSMFNQLTTFGEDDDGELYAATLEDQLYRLVPDGFLPVYLTHFDLIPGETTVDLRWKVENVADITMFTLERSTDGIFFRPIGIVTPAPDKLNYTFTDLVPGSTINYYRLVYTLFDGSAQISAVRTIDRSHYEISTEIYTHASGGLAVIFHGDVGQTGVLVYSSDGRIITRQNIDESYSDIEGTRMLPVGVYVVVVKSDAHTWIHKWLKH
ncbi:MAG TPA: PQQ-dependent sugar dehydrogenase [Saprospiraceae bacterium]|nr:PQQ-dependent sugar dehydrogenase [Saprospiraceae bacterium]